MFIKHYYYDANLFLQPRSHAHQTLSNSSSEYTTPAQSTSASPTADRRPLSQAVFGLSPTHLTTHSRQISAPAEWAGSSPTLSPTHPSKILMIKYKFNKSNIYTLKNKIQIVT